MLRARTILLLITASVLTGVVLCSCSTAKNTGGTRFYHSVTARFNVMHNGKTAYGEGVEAQTKGHKDDYTSLLPMYVSADKKTAAMGKSNFETAITKAEKAIKKHSIKRKPKKPKGRMSDKQKAYFARNEFNPYIHNAWMLLADAQFRTGDFIEAAATYNYIARLYQTQPEISGVARARMALCYVLLDWPYDAEDLLRKLDRDSLASRYDKCRREIEATRAAFYIATEQYAEAIPMLRATAPRAKPKLQRARLYYLLGQLCANQNDKTGAYKALAKCIHLNPPYELAFNARIMQTEVMAAGQGKAMIRKLMRMTKNPNNADYLDRIYYAIGNIHLASRDTMRAIYAWEKGIEESTQNGYAKAIVLQHLGELQWERADYIKATPCYTELVSLMNKERKEYREVERRSKILAEIEPHLSAVKLQDSLQALAKLPEKEYLAAIDRVISDLKKKEREAERKAAANGTQGRTGTTPQTAGTAQKPAAGATGTAARRGQNATFYFYTPQTVSQGKQDFQRKWGQRANEDNWRFSSKQGLAGADGGGGDLAEADSLSMGDEGTLSEEEQARLDSLANDPHEREYYLRQIPFTDEQVEASNLLIRDGLYNGGVLLQDKVENFDMAHSTLQRLIRDFPDFDKMDDVYYHLFLLAMRRGEEEQMQTYLTLMCDSFPDSRLTQTISHPRFIELAQNGRHLEDSLYAATYDAYKAGNYDEVDRNFATDTTDFDGGAHQAKFPFIHAMTQLYTGHQDTFFAELKQLTQKYSSDEIAEMAKYIVQGISDGRLLNTDKWDASNIWSMRSLAASADSTNVADTLVAEPAKPFVFVLAYPTGELDENQLIYEVAAYNFTTFQARNFDISTAQVGVISQLRVTGFKSYEEVHLYAQQLYSDPHMRTLLEGIRIVLISEDNLRLLGTRYSYEDYTEFFDENLSTLPVSDELILDEPTDLPTVDPEDVPAPNEDNEDATDGEEEDDGGTSNDDDWLW